MFVTILDILAIVLAACGGAGSAPAGLTATPIERTQFITPLSDHTYYFVGDFETGDLTGFWWHQNKPEVVTAPHHPVRGGTYSMRSYLHRYESRYSYRTEVALCADDSMPEGTNEPMMLNNTGGPESEYWIGFSVYIPSDFVVDIERLTDLVFQIHGKPDKDSSGEYMEPYRQPMFALEINEDRWRIFIRGDPNAISESMYPPFAENYYEEPLGADIGKWTDWVFHIRFSYEEDGDGFFKIWRDGQLVVDHTGPNCYNDERGPHPAMGIYKWPWKKKHDYPSNTDWRLFYHDELRIASADASYEDVAP